ncbi:uncharacterized protein [Diadema setosum]|uniref:uncharacterized protein n=1 Tax=Diadema setosum TaxID=31175 RepID=UPI003B3AF681
MSRTNSVTPLVPEVTEVAPVNADHVNNGFTMRNTQAFELIPPITQSNGTPKISSRQQNNDIKVSDDQVHDKKNGGHLVVSLEPEENEKGRSSLDYRTDLDMDFYYCLRPLLLCMQFFGIWHGYIVDPLHNPPPKTLFKKIFNSKNYSVVVQIFLWFNAIRYFPSFFTGSLLDPQRLFAKVIFQVFTLQCALNSSVFFWCLSKPNKVAIFFHHFEVSIQTNPEARVDPRWLRRGSWVCAVIGCIFITIHFLNQGTNTMLPLELFRNNSVIFSAPMESSYPLQFLFLVIFVYDFAAWVFPLLFFILICLMLSRQFVLLDSRLEKSLRIARLDGCFPKDFEILRRQHEALATAVDTSNDGLFTFVNLVTYMTMAPLACFLLYRIISPVKYALGITGWVMYWTWIISIFINVIVASWIAALVSDRAHDPRERLFMVNLWNITNEEIMQMNVFLNRLSGDPIGYTIFDLVTITKPFILTIGGLLLTYYALISEFQG